MNIGYFILFGICFVCHVLRMIYEIEKFKKNRLKDNIWVFLGMTVVMVTSWFSWFSMAEADPLKMDIPPVIQYIGLGLFILGLGLALISFITLRGMGYSGRLVTTGIFKKIRHPMYYGFILWLVGYSLFNKALLTLCTSVIWLFNILFWITLEEKLLAKAHPEYAEYKKQTWI
jgi:protein-S-isoprenylcysteine O-methyltransferase Ste14